MKELKDYVISIPDFPEPGIIFRDITGILQSAEGLHMAIDQLQKELDGVEFDLIAGAEARGFIFGMPLSWNTVAGAVGYELEYGTATIEIHKDAIKPGQKVVLVDDLIATGGTIKAAANLIESLGGEVVKILFVMELAGLNGRKVLEGYDVSAAITYEGK